LIEMKTKTLTRRIQKRAAKTTCYLQTLFSGKRTRPAGDRCKCLYVSPVGSNGKDFLAKTIHSFGTDRFDYLIFSYDGTRFEEPVFSRCHVIHEKGLRWEFMKKYVTPSYCEAYDYIFAWADDIDIEDFSIDNYLRIVTRNGLELSQPALTATSFYSHKITLRQNNIRFGRFTDFVEIMIPVFERQAWDRFWNSIMTTANGWGWGYDLFARSKCGYRRMGIIDCETVRHTRNQRSPDTKTLTEFENYVRDNASQHRMSLKISYGGLK